MNKIKILMIIFFGVLISSCSSKQINVSTIKLSNEVYDRIAIDTLGIVKEYLNPKANTIYIFGADDKDLFLASLDFNLRNAGYPVHQLKKQVDALKDDDIAFSFILDTISKSKIEKNVLSTVRYTFSINNITCSKLYEINNFQEIMFKSEWNCLGE